MQILLGMKDFGKIKSAEVNLGGFSVFVGNNNSGKTYVMQLIYGIRKNLPKYLSDQALYSKYLLHLESQADEGKVIIDAESVKVIEEFFNEVLKKYKDKIVLDTFFEEIELGEVYVRLLMEEDEQLEWLVYRNGDSEEKLDAMINQLDEDKRQRSRTLVKESGLYQEEEFYCAIFKFRMLKGQKERLYEKYYFQKLPIWLEIIYSAAELLTDKAGKILFLPASRTGLLMLYKEFFANKADEAIKIMRVEDFDSHEKEPRKLGITQPIYDFLRFIQTFSQKRGYSEKNDLIQFIEQHLIEGRILIGQGNEPVYQAQGAQRGLPLYLSSSMINELMPALYLLQSVEQPKYLIWDEIETSLHPQKQMELARLLCRMSNAGFSMIVSTHSDTMAAKINNLCLLSFSQFLKGKRTDILQKAGLEEADLFKERIHVYQFENDNYGRSFIKELEYDEMTGYQFTLFNDSVEKLFQETSLILE